MDFLQNRIFNINIGVIFITSIGDIFTVLYKSSRGHDFFRKEYLFQTW